MADKTLKSEHLRPSSFRRFESGHNNKETVLIFSE